MGGDEKTSTILVIEDDADIRDSMCRFFEGQYEVMTAENGLVALDKLRTCLTQPCVVFLDMMMPVMNGWEFLSKATSEKLLAGVKVVITTAAPKNMIPSGISFLQKPFSLHDIERYCEESCAYLPGAKEKKL